MFSFVIMIETKEKPIKFENDFVFRKYLKDIGKYPLLTPEEEKQLAEEAQAGSKTAFDRLVNCNLRLVIAFSKKYFYAGLDPFDLVQSGNVGLIEAAKHFDPSLGFRFSTYAVPWIKRECFRYLTEMKHLISLNPHAYVEMIQLKTAAEDELNIDFCDATNEDILELSRITGVPAGRATKIINACIPYVSIDSGINDGTTNFQLEEIISSEDDQRIEDDFIDNETFADMLRAIEQLPPKEAEVVKMRFGLYEDDSMTLQEVAEQMNLSREGVRQKERNAIKKIKKMMEKGTF